MEAQFHPRNISALSLAGYVAWGTTAVGVWRVAAGWPGLAGIPGQLVAVTLLMVFMAAFVLLTMATPVIRSGLRLWLIGVMIGSTFALFWCGTSGLSPTLLIIIAVALTSGFLPPIALGALIAVNLAFYMVLVRLWHADDPGFSVLVYGSFQVFAAVTAGARAKSEAAAADLQQMNAGLLATRALLAESARDAERLRVSRELHDVAGHRLTALKLNLDVLSLEPALAHRREVAAARQLTGELLGDIRNVVSRLRHDDGIDIREALRRIVEPFPRPAIHLQIPDEVRVEGAERADAVVRACQEALTNAVRHAAAQNIWITLVQNASGIELIVRDDGNFHGSHVQGSGLTGMKERVEQAGGRVRAGRSVTGGFEVAVQIAANHL